MAERQSKFRIPITHIIRDIIFNHPDQFELADGNRLTREIGVQHLSFDDIESDDTGKQTHVVVTLKYALGKSLDNDVN